MTSEDLRTGSASNYIAANVAFSVQLDTEHLETFRPTSFPL